ncbi:helix-turn-helix transcriptional regulator [Salinicoccus sp. ID82-1]|uniref:helix-turn-helix domain-containing protein n=1 Tax=Salinicoccus sp. ID82-1 TaxID=2820269 RepID=UPI001F3B3CEC|nr:helix-turn-helix transcriptional regulator [Salinicoccus sp. ID82-1]MCG1010912.1 helix-turn-helix transcriptional regulator [Salinicoccus sp. ID82-1]
MTYIDELKVKYIDNDPESERFFSEMSNRLDISVMIVYLRDEYNLSQHELAEKAGVAKSTIARIENGSVNTTVQMLDRIAKSVGKELKIEIV